MQQGAAGQYYLGVIRTASPEPLHAWETWQGLTALLDSWLALSPHEAAIRSFQMTPGRGNWLPLGRMKWGPKANEKWTTKYLADEALNATLHETEVWAPSWTKLTKAHQVPDLFLKLDCDERQEPHVQGLFLAIRSGLSTDPLGDRTAQVTRAMASTIPSAELRFLTRPWGVRVTDTGYRSGIADLSAAELLSDSDAGEWSPPSRG